MIIVSSVMNIELILFVSGLLFDTMIDIFKVPTTYISTNIGTYCNKFNQTHLHKTSNFQLSKTYTSTIYIKKSLSNICD